MQPLEHKLGVIRTLAHRCATICKDRESRMQETHAAFEKSAKCFRIHQEGLEGGNWILPKGTLFRPSIIWIQTGRFGVLYQMCRRTLLHQSYVRETERPLAKWLKEATSRVPGE